MCLIRTLEEGYRESGSSHPKCDFKGIFKEEIDSNGGDLYAFFFDAII